MSLYLFDTDTFSHSLRSHPVVTAHISRNKSLHQLGLSIISVEELWDGWQAVIRKAKSSAQLGSTYGRLTATLTEIQKWMIWSFTEVSADRYLILRKLKLNVGANDLRIAAIALELGAVLVTANTRDFSRIPNLVLEDWTK